MPMNFYNPLYEDTYQMAIPCELSGAVVRFSSNGWLLMSRGEYSLFFFNQFTNAKIDLPDLPEYYYFDTISFSSVPTSSDCTVFGILGLFNDIAWFSSISRGEESWTWAKEEDSSWTVLDGPKKPRGCDSVHESYLMECDGKLLSVFVGNRGRGVSVYTLHESEMAWQRVTDLGSKVLFVSHSTSFSSTKVVEGMENKIYFPRLCGKDGIFYCLATNRYGSFGSNIRKKNLRGIEEQLHCSWIEPITRTYTEEEK